MTRTPRLRRFVATTLAALLVLATVVPTAIAKGPPSPPPGPPPVSIQILGLNDYHGQLEPLVATATSGGRIGSLTDTNPDPNVTTLECLPATCLPAGGTEYLATHVANLKKTNKNTVFVSAGDLIGATPLLSALFHDEPSIEAFNIMGLDYNGVGNHEFDEGVDELLRIAYGNRRGPGYQPDRRDGCHPVDGCGDGDPYGGAKFDFLAANVVYKDSGKTIFPPYAIHRFQGVQVAFVGMTLEGTPEIVSPAGIASVDFLDEAASVNALVPHLKKKGVEAIVVLLHEGGSVAGGAGGNLSLINSCNAPPNAPIPNAPNSPTGAIPQIVPMMDDEVDIVVTGHTNWAVNCLIDGKVVTGAASQGRLITDIDAKLDRKTRDFVPGSITVNNQVVTQDVPKAPAITKLIAEYNAVAGPVGAVVVGNTVTALSRGAIAGTSDTQLGRLIADAQLAHPSVAGAQIALMNPGGIRSDLDAGPITHAEAFGVQPFSNVLMVRSFTGAQIEAILEQQFTAAGAPRVILQVSNGFTYTWSTAAPAGNKIASDSIKLNGVTLDQAATYQVAMNNFLGFGGDSFPTMTAGSIVKFGADDLVALEDFLAANNPYDAATAATPRIIANP